MRKSHEELFKIHYTTPVYPELNVPPLLQLLQRDKYPEHDEFRFEILFWIITNGKLTAAHDIMKVPKRFRVYVMILVYMKALKAISNEEAEIFLLSLTAIPKEIFEGISEEYLYAQKLDGRAFRLCFLFTTLHSEIEFAFQSVGLEELAVRNCLETKISI